LSCQFTGILADEKQKIEIKSSDSTHNTYSNWDKIKHVVPQESILGPFFS
jgi:hypothetical protein